MYDDPFFYVCIFLSLVILGVSLHTIYETKTNKMKYQDGIVLKNGLIPATKEETALYFEKEEEKRQLESLPKHDRLSRFLHNLFKFFIPDHKKAIERRIKATFPKATDVKVNQVSNEELERLMIKAGIKLPKTPKPNKRKI